MHPRSHRHDYTDVRRITIQGMLELMPDMMPKVMDNLMPHMIGDVVPLVTQPMIDYLRGK